MEIKDLLIFQSVAQQGSISKAAKELSYVQSHITTRIKALESRLKTQLFHRHSRGTTLNSEGEKLLLHTEKILRMLDEMEKSFQDSNNPSGTLGIGTVETVINLPVILSTYHRNYPNVDLSLITGVTKNLIRQILKRKLDGAFVADFGDHPEIEQVEVFQEKLVLISSNENISFEDLKRKPLLVFAEGCSYRMNLENWLHDDGIMNVKVMEFGTLETILGSVMSGLGISLVPQSTVHQLEMDGAIRCHAIPEIYSKVSTVFIRHVDTYLTNTMEKFIETVQDFTATTHPPVLQMISKNG